MSLAIGQSVKFSHNVQAVLTTADITTASSGSGLWMVVVYEPSMTFVSVQDSKSNTWVQIGSTVTDGSNVLATRRYKCVSATGGTNHNFTLTCNSAGVAHIAVVEITTTNGLGVTVDQQNAAADSSSPYTSPSVATTVADEFLISMMTCQGPGGTYTHTAGNSFTKFLEESDGSTYFPLAIGNRTVSATGSYSGSWTVTTTPADSVVSIDTFYETLSGPGAGSDLSSVGMSESSSNLIRVSTIEETS